MHIDEIDIRKIKDAANVVDVISDFINLKKKGSEYISLCPFHADRIRRVEEMAFQKFGKSMV